MQTIKRQELKDRMDRDEFQAVVEVLAPEAYEEFHLPDAVNVPFDDKFSEKIESIAPDRSKPVVVYCKNAQCDASPKAARKMDELGYQQVYDYEEGKMDWKDAGLPIEKGWGWEQWKSATGTE